MSVPGNAAAPGGTEGGNCDLAGRLISNNHHTPTDRLDIVLAPANTAHLLDYALNYARSGWPVFPCKPTGAAPLTKRGFYDATTDADQITKWWTMKPDASIGIPTGIAFDVLDIDHNDYREGVADLPGCATEGGPIVRSGGGNWHLYFRPSGLGRHIRFAEHCDWLGTDGYVIVPPSGHKSGGSYTWFTDWSLELTDAPAELIDAFKASRAPKPSQTPRVPLSRPKPVRPGSWSAAGLIAQVATAPDGKRNTVLNWAAHAVGSDVYRGNVSASDGLAALDQIAIAAERSGLDTSEVDQTIESGYTAGLAGKKVAA